MIEKSDPIFIENSNTDSNTEEKDSVPDIGIHETQKKIFEDQ